MTLFVKLRWAVFLILAVVVGAASAFDWPTSGRTESIRNPFVAIGFDPTTKNITGYGLATRIAPGNTDACAFVFLGNIARPNEISIAYLDDSDAVDGGKISSIPAQHAALMTDRNQFALRIEKSKIQGDCEWILSFVGEPGIHESTQDLLISLGNLSAGDWIGVYAVKAPRAHFHKVPNDSSIQRSFVVKGDMVYVYKRTSDWCFAKYEKRGRKTAGWLKTSDLVFGMRE